MGLKEILSILVLVLAVLGQARHTHHERDLSTEVAEERVIALNNDRDLAETEVINAAPNQGPVNSILFFKSYDPCEEGFKLDYQGICREVWF